MHLLLFIVLPKKIVLHKSIKSVLDWSATKYSMQKGIQRQQDINLIRGRVNNHWKNNHTCIFSYISGHQVFHGT